MNLKKIIYYLLLALLFLLPWQTRWIYDPQFLNSGWWEYGTGSFYATEILLWLVIILSFVNILKNKELLKKIITKEYWSKHKITLLFYILILLIFGLEIFFSLNQQISFNWFFHLLEGACLVVVIAQLSFQPAEWRGEIPVYWPTPPMPPCEGGIATDIPRRQRGLAWNNKINLLLTLWLSGVVQGLLALWQFFDQQVLANKWLGLAYHSGKQLGDFVIELGAGGNTERWLRAYGAFGSPNILGGFLAVIWVLGIYLLFTTNSAKLKNIITAGQVIILSGLILSWSRAAWLAAVAGVVVLSLVILSGVKRSEESLFQLVMNGQGSFARSDVLRGKLRMTILKQLFYSFLIILFFFFALKPLFLTRVNNEGRLEAKSINTRVAQYKDWLNIVGKNSPAIFGAGIGPGVYTLAAARLHPGLYGSNYQPIHNSYLLIIAELGYIGFAFFVALFILLWNHVKKNNRLFLPVIVAILVGGLFDHWWVSMYFGLVFWGVVIGLGLRR